MTTIERPYGLQLLRHTLRWKYTDGEAAVDLGTISREEALMLRNEGAKTVGPTGAPATTAANWPEATMSAGKRG